VGSGRASFPIPPWGFASILLLEVCLQKGMGMQFFFNSLLSIRGRVTNETAASVTTTNTG